MTDAYAGVKAQPYHHRVYWALAATTALLYIAFPIGVILYPFLFVASFVRPLWTLQWVLEGLDESRTVEGGRREYTQRINK